MALRFIIGRANKGKSYYIYNEIKQHIFDARSKEKLILLVPEQYTLQAERDFLERTQLKGIMQLEILSFSRLAQRIFNEVGGLTRVVINEQGKNMVLRRVIDQLEENFSVYNNCCHQNGFVSELSSFIAGLKQRAVSVQDLIQMQNDIAKDSLLERKLKDLALIYQQFDTYLHEHYIDSEDYMNLLIEKMANSQYLSNSRIWVDNFATYSPQSLRIIEKIMSICPQITISLTLSKSKSQRDEELFALSRRSYYILNEIARYNGINTELIEINDTFSKRVQNEELLHLESELYAYPNKKFTGSVNGISIFSAPNPDSEVEDVAARLISLVRDQGYRWKDIAVICNDLDTYGGLVRRIFREYEIPYFMDQKKDIMDNPIIELILSSIQCVERGYLYEDIFRCLKTGLGALDDESCEELENYVLAYGIRGNRWKAPFTKGEQEKLEDLNQWRQVVISPLEKMKLALSHEKSFAGFTKILYDYLEDLNIQEKLKTWIDELQEQELYEVVFEYNQIWKIVIETFDQMVEILGEQEGNLKQYIKILEAGFSSHELGIIPTTVDQVLVGNIQRSKSHSIKALFVMGVNDGIIPAGKFKEGIISADECDYLNSNGIELTKSREMQAAEENFLIYNALSKCQEKLFFSYSSSDSGGRALRSSFLLDRISCLFPQLQIESGLINTPLRQLQMISRPRSSFKHLVTNLRQYLDQKPMDDLWWNVYDWYCQQDNWQMNCNSIVKAFFHRNQEKNIKTEQVKRLYSFPLRTSVTRLEKYIACPFAHFVHYGLSPRERKEFSVKAPDIGEIFHNSLLAFALEIEKRPGKWQGLERQESDLIMDTVMNEIITGQEEDLFSSSNRYQYLGKRLKRIGCRAAWTISEHIKRGGFTPLGYEIQFGQAEGLPALTIEMASGERVYLQGRIDRVDILDTSEASYVRIIDYKTGDKKLNLADCYYGLSLQLLIYLHVVLACQQELRRPVLKPGGIFYFKIDDPLINSEGQVREVIEQQLVRELKLRGLTLKDINIVREMDHNISASSDIIPVGLKQDDTFHSHSAVLNELDFNFLLGHINKLLQKACDELAGGKVKIEPYKIQDHTACEYCPYISICQFDRQLPGNNYRNLLPLTDEEVIHKIEIDKEVQS